MLAAAALTLTCVSARAAPAASALTVYAGSPSEQGSADGSAAAARFYAPGGITADAAGNVYVADSGNQTIRRITPAGVVTTLAGAAGERGTVDGIGAAARFDVPSGICVDARGNLYVADAYGSTIRRIDRAGVVSTLAGVPGSRGFADGRGAAARFQLPQGIAVDAERNVYVADTYNNAIRMISPQGLVTTLAGAAGEAGFADGTGAAARFNLPSGIAVGPSGDLYVTDQGNSVIRLVTRAGAARTFAGAAQQAGRADGSGGRARFHEPFGIAADHSGTLYVSDTGNHIVRAITREGAVRTISLTAPASSRDDGTPGSVASAAGPSSALSFPGGLAARAGFLYISDGNAIFALRASQLR